MKMTRKETEKWQMRVEATLDKVLAATYPKCKFVVWFPDAKNPTHLRVNAKGKVDMKAVDRLIRAVIGGAHDIKKLPSRKKKSKHDCNDYATPYSDRGGALGHGWECGKCGRLLQVG